MTNKFIYLLKKSFLLRFSVLLSFILTAILLTSGLSFLLHKKPIITSIEPQVFQTGNTVTIKGLYFGKPNTHSFINVGNSVINSESCLLWTENEIIFKINDRKYEGLICVSVRHKKSASFFIANKESIPAVNKPVDNNGAPSIESLSTDYAAVGEAITVYGENFGTERNNAQVLFVKNYDAAIVSRLKQMSDIEAAYCSEHDFDFKIWNNKELCIRVPDGADSGMIIIINENGISNAVPFRLKDKTGTKTLLGKKNFIISAEADVSNFSAKLKNSLFLRMPLPVDGTSQTDVAILSINHEPLIKNYDDTVIHKFDNLTEKSKITIKQEYSLTRKQINTALNPESIKIGTKNNPDIYSTYTALDTFDAGDVKILKEHAHRITGGEKNPYYAAKKIYDALLKEILIVPSAAGDIGRKAVASLEEKKGSPYDAAVLFSGLCRVLNIPAEPIAGIAVDKNQNTKLHWWAQFYVEGFGWIPVDIGMAKGVPFSSSFSQKENWYFGNLDDMRVAFSYGKKDIQPMTVNGSLSPVERSYAFLDAWLEAVNITAYTSFLHTPQVKAIY